MAQRNIERRERRVTTLRTSEVAWLLGTNSKTVRTWVKAGVLKASRARDRGRLEFRRDDVAFLLAKLGV